MFKRIRNMHPLTGIVVGAVATLVLSGTAIAVTDTNFTYSTTQTGYLMIGPADLVPAGHNSANDYRLDLDGVSTLSGACFVAPVHLPQAARMTSVRTSYYSAAGSNPSLSLVRVNPVTGAAADLIPPRVVVDDSGRTTVTDAVPAYGLISNGLYTYTYGMCVGSYDAFYGARIAYQYTNAGD